ncbi:MAG: stage III sporulation protein AE [Lachnospiraceae bacterium]|nr:stage III sporulation protein AE [Lachnospiraceae bacterium]
MKLIFFLIIEAMLLGLCGGHACAEEMTETADTLEKIEDFLNLDEIDKEFPELLSGSGDFSFSDTFRKLVKGEMPVDIQRIPSFLSDMFLSELKQQKQMALQILIIVLASAVFSNFIKVFDSSQIADISFYMMYLLISGLLIKSFMTMNQIVVYTCNSVNLFMKILLPAYLVTVVLCSGSVSALGFYEITVLGISMTQTMIVRIILPIINFYLMLLILNQMSEEDYFSKFAELLETVTDWILKTVTGLIVGLQAVQCLIAPSVDSLKNTAAQRLAKAIPGIGNILDSAAETVAASALVIKNAAGIAGILALVFICLLPVIKLAVCILIFRLLCAVIQPVSEKRMVEGIESISRGTVLLLKILVMSVSVFIISIAMITAAVKGG